MLEIERGSDLNFTATWGGASPIDLTGMTVSATDAHPALAGNLSLQITDAAAGLITGRIEWVDTMPLGAVMFFRIMLTDGGDTQTTPQIQVLVK